MADEELRTCFECDGTMSPIVIMDKNYRRVEGLEYRRPDDTRSFWTGKFPSAGPVQAFLCEDCGRIVLYGVVSET